MKLKTQITRNGKIISYDHPVIMGILNLTADSFYDGGKYNTLDNALRHVEFMVKNGAEIIDIGGESSRPGAEPISEDEELDRIMPVLERVCKEFNVVVSVDTYKSGVAEESLKCGADIINDISGFNFDSKMAEVIKNYNAIGIIMHMKGTPKTMQLSPTYKNVVKEVFDFFKNLIKKAVKTGIKRENLILDVGIGFGKKLNHNIELLKNISIFKKFGLPLLLGASRKSMIGMILGDTDKINEKVKPPEAFWDTWGKCLWLLNGS